MLHSWRRFQSNRRLTRLCIVPSSTIEEIPPDQAKEYDEFSLYDMVNSFMRTYNGPIQPYFQPKALFMRYIIAHPLRNQIAHFKTNQTKFRNVRPSRISRDWLLACPDVNGGRNRRKQNHDQLRLAGHRAAAYGPPHPAFGHLPLREEGPTQALERLGGAGDVGGD